MKKIISWTVVLSMIALWAFVKYKSASLQAQKELNGGGKRTLHLFAMSGYFPDEVIKDYETKNNAEVRYDNFSSNEELLAKLQAGATGYDVIVPSDYMIRALISGRLIRELDKSQIPNFSNVAKDFVNVPYDPQCKYSVPYTWGTTGLVYNKKYVKFPVDSWDVLFKKEVAGRISLLDDEREVMGAMLHKLGFSTNTTNADELKKAQLELIRLKPSVRLFASDPKQHILSGDIWIAQVYSGDAKQVMASDPDIDYVTPKEGGTIWVDTFAIPVKASSVDLAYSFLNTILDPHVGKIITEKLLYNSPNVALENLLAQDDLKASYLRHISVGKLEFLKDLGAETEHVDQLWTEAKSR